MVYAAKGDIVDLAIENTKGDKVDYLSAVWSSNNPDVAEVDQEGHVTVANPGIATITVTATPYFHGSEHWSEMKDYTKYITLNVTTNGVEDVCVDDNATVDVYSAEGILLRSGADRDYISGLDTGFYIMVNQQGAKKVYIK